MLCPCCFPGKVRPIRRKTFPSSTAPGKGIEWQWLDDTGWSPYDITAGNIVEEAYEKGQKILDLSHTNCKLPYTVDFTNMEQTRRGSGFQRQIRRVTLNPCYPKVQSVDEDSDDEGTLSGPSVDSPAATVTSSSAGGSSTVARSGALLSSSTSTVISDEVSTAAETSTSGMNPATATGGCARGTKRASGKRTSSRKAVAAATSGVQATVAWSTPPGSSSGASSTTVSSSAGTSMPRSSSVPGAMGPDVTTTISLVGTLSSSSS